MQVVEHRNERSVASFLLYTMKEPRAAIYKPIKAACMRISGPLGLQQTPSPCRIDGAACPGHAACPLLRKPDLGEEHDVSK